MDLILPHSERNDKARYCRPGPYRAGPIRRLFRSFGSYQAHSHIIADRKDGECLQHVAYDRQKSYLPGHTYGALASAHVALFQHSPLLSLSRTPICVRPPLARQFFLPRSRARLKSFDPPPTLHCQLSASPDAGFRGHWHSAEVKHSPRLKRACSSGPHDRDQG